MKFKNKIFRMILQILVLTLVGGYFTSNLIQSTFATNVDRSPNLTVTINSDGSISQIGDLFEGQLYPATEEQAEKGIGSISGVIRISNQYEKIDVENIAIGLEKFVNRNDYPRDMAYDSFLSDVRLKIEKGRLFSFDKKIIDYTNLGSILLDKNSDKYRGYVLEQKDRFIIAKGDTVDLKYTLHMVEQADNELQSITVNMPIYINLKENIVDNGDNNDPDYDDDDDYGYDDDDEVIIIDEGIPLGILNRDDHIQYIQGYPDGNVRPEGLITREEVSAVFYRLLEANYRSSILTLTEDFPDVDSNRWSTRHIATLAKGNIIKGYPDGNFMPGNFITRAELATIASRFDRLSPFVKNSFSDIDGHWANKYINSAFTKGWINGYPDGTFKPDQYITRAEFVTLVNNVLDRRVHKEDILVEAKQFPDLDLSAWYYEAMQEAINSHTYTRLEDMYEEWIDIYYPVLDM